MSKKSQRLDVLLVERGEVTSRERARRLIMAGGVRVGARGSVPVLVDKPGKQVPYDAVITVQQSDIPYVSRGGLKLQKAIDYFSIDVTGKVAIDVGASTGGFTDCLLQNGAGFVYAVDVGYGQLDWKLRRDERVAVFERTNIRYVRPEQFPSTSGEAIDLATIDVSFISLEKVVPVVASLLPVDGQIIALIKPQFEAGRHNVGKGGVVKDPDIHRQVIRNILDLAARTELTVRGLTYSPVKGPAGNIEYLIWLQKGKDTRYEEVTRDQSIVTSQQSLVNSQQSIVNGGLATSDCQLKTDRHPAPSIQNVVSEAHAAL